MPILNSNFTDESNLTKRSILSTNFEQTVKKGGRNKKVLCRSSGETRTAIKTLLAGKGGSKPCQQVAGVVWLC
jgi:hypothetical protein